MHEPSAIRSRLVDIFVDLFKISPEQAEEATMANTEKWDSFSHMSLVLAIESRLMSSEVDPDAISELTSFQACLDYVMRTSQQ